ncbi:MAG: RNA polymerase sigma factor [Planctomycetes bacterium]|nr:RNA polymerase sigma factor [Planctomycetota bacterium]
MNRPSSPIEHAKEAAAYLPLDDESAAQFVADWTAIILSQMARFRLPADLAEDASQEALLRAMRALPKFRGKSKLSTWIYSIAWREGHRAHQRWQKRKSREISTPNLADCALQAGSVGETEHSGAENPDPVAIADDFIMVQRAMDQLPSNQRLALGYHYLEELSVSEIAELMNTATGTVKSWLKRGRDRLRERLYDGATR